MAVFCEFERVGEKIFKNLMQANIVGKERLGHIRRGVNGEQEPFMFRHRSKRLVQGVLNLCQENRLRFNGHFTGFDL